MVCYCLVEYFCWGDLIYIYLLVCLLGMDYYLVNVFGLSFDEVIVLNFVKVDLVGNIFDDMLFKINLVGFMIYSVIYEVCDDVYCVIYLYIKEIIVVVM